MAQYKPLHDYVVIKPLDDDEKTKGGIILPDTVDKEKPEKGEIMAVGEGRGLDKGQRKPMEVRVGDIVVFKKYSPDELPGEENQLIIREEDILAIVKK